MKVLVDGIIYQNQSHGGISRLYNEILPRMCAMDDSLWITLLTSGRCRQPLPLHARIRHRPLFPVNSILRPGRLWWPVVPRIRAFVQQSAVGDGRGRIWHSTYYTMLDKWKGATVVTVHDMIHERFVYLFNGSVNEQFRKRKQQCILTADAIVCVSESTKRDVQQFYGIDLGKIYVVPHAHSDVFRPLENNLKPPVEKPFLLYVGGRAQYKNFSVLLQAYSHWSRRREVDLVVVGPRWSREERRHCMRLGITEQVHLLTDVDDQRLCLLYNQTSAFVFPSLYEGFGIPLLEAMACGCPVIASRISTTLEVAAECPIYFKPTEAEDLAAAFDVVLSEGRGSERVRLGLERVERYSWDKTARQTWEVYRALSNPE